MKSRYGLMLVGLLVAGVAQSQTCSSDTSPVDRFEMRNGGATVFDKLTGLEWKRCPEDYVLDTGSDPGTGDDTCTDGGSSTFNWQQALQDAKNLDQGAGYAGATDWRVPNAKELRSIVEEACEGPAIDLAVFPGTPSAMFWSASPYSGNALFSWHVSFIYGEVDWSASVFSAMNVRLVRGGQ